VCLRGSLSVSLRKVFRGRRSAVRRTLLNLREFLMCRSTRFASFFLYCARAAEMLMGRGLRRQVGRRSLGLEFPCAACLALRSANSLPKMSEWPGGPTEGEGEDVAGSGGSAGVEKGADVSVNEVKEVRARLRGSFGRREDGGLVVQRNGGHTQSGSVSS